MVLLAAGMAQYLRHTLLRHNLDRLMTTAIVATFASGAALALSLWLPSLGRFGAHPAFPLPWANDAASSFVETPDEYLAAARGAGFDLVARRDRGEVAQDFFARMHGPSMGNTVGAGCVLLASMLTSSALAGRPIVHELLITLFIVMSSPVTSMMLMSAALYRYLARGSD